MRFLILSQYFHPEIGAAQVRLAAMAHALQQQGHEVEVVTAMPNYPTGRIFPEYRGRWYQREQWEGMTVHRYWSYAATGAGAKRMLNYLSFMFIALLGMRHAQKPDYVFVESPPLFLGITGYLYARRWGVPFIFNVADLWPDSVKALGFMRDGWLLRSLEALEAWIYRKAAFVNAVTEGVYELLQQEKQLPPDKVLFLPNGVDTDIFYPRPPDEALRQRLNLPTHQHLLLYAGTHGYAHGMETLLAAAQLVRELPIVFLLVGGGSEKAALQQQAQALQLDNVIFLAPRPPAEIAPLYSIATAGVSTLRGEPLFDSVRPVKILANMACGRPVIYSGRGEGAALVRQANAGPIVPPNDAQALAQAIRDLLANPAQQAEYGDNGRRYVLSHLQWSAVVSRWLQQLQAATTHHE